MKNMTIMAILAFVGQFAVAESVDTTRTYNIGEVVVTGSNNPTSRNLLPYTVAVVGAEEMEAKGHSQVLSALSGQVPSLFVAERNIFGFGISNGGSGGIKIRGVGGSPTNAILMMVDGQPQFAGIYSHHVADFYENEYVDHVEVLRGPASVLYGSNAMGGVVNVITKESRRDGVRTALKTQYGSYNTWQSAATNMVRKGKFSSLISASYDRTDGVSDGLDFKQGAGYVKLGYDFSDAWRLRADYSVMKFVGNDPIYPKLSDPTSTDVYHQNVVRGEASISMANSYERTNGNVRVYYSYGNHYVDDPRHFHSLDDRFGVLAYQNFEPWQGADATVGFDFDSYTGQIPMSGGVAHTEGSMSTIGHKSITEYSPYLTVAQNLLGERLTINAGVRVANSDVFDTHVVPQLGVAGHIGEGWLVKGSAARGYRNPSFRELYLYRPANPELQPESMWNYEVSVGKRFGVLFGFDLTAYYSEGADMIQVVQMKNVNTGEFTNKGIELVLNSRPTESLSLRASYSYLHTSLSDLTGAPKNQVFVGATWQPIERLLVEAELRGIGGLYVADTVERQNYALLNLRVDYEVANWLNVFGLVDNLSDADYVINEGYEMPGLNATVGVKLNF